MKKALAAIILLGGAALAAGAATTAKLGSGSRLWIEGDSTMHKWESSATKLEVAVTMDGSSLASGMAAQAPAKLTLSVPVKEMKSEHGGLDKNLQNALKADQFTDIVFTMSGYKLDQAAGTVAATGELSIAGVTKPEIVIAKYAEKDGKLILDGQQPLLMTDFGVKPPTAVLGTIKAEDRVVVKFHVELEPAGAASTTKDGK